jgi:hypothetical protein
VKTIRKTFGCMPALKVCIELAGDGEAVSVDVVRVGVDERCEVIVSRSSIEVTFGKGSDAARVSKLGVMCCLLLEDRMKVGPASAVEEFTQAAKFKGDSRSEGGEGSIDPEVRSFA